MNAIYNAQPQPQIPAHTAQVRRALPRLFFPSEPVFLLEGASRTFKYGGDNRLSQDNTLTCRLSGFYVEAVSATLSNNDTAVGLFYRSTALADPILERGISNGSVPPECEDLLRETVLLDPSAAYSLAQSSLTPPTPFRYIADTASANAKFTFAAARAAAPKVAAAPAQVNALAQNIMVEQTAWWATRDPRFDHGPLVANSGYSGTLPSPIAVNGPVKPWNPRHLDWKMEYIPSTNGLADWSLGEIDFATDPKLAPPAPGVPSTVGQSPDRAVPNKFAAGIAKGLLQWGLADATNSGLPEDALSALLRIIDSTLWAVDPFGSATDEHLSLLIGHPVAVLRARVRLEVQEPIDTSVINTKPVPLRLGAITRWQDGLLGYFVNDDYTKLYCADAAVAGFARQIGPGQGFLQQANLVPNYYQTFSDDIGDAVTEGTTPVTHPYVDNGLLMIQPNQEVNLTLLVEPHCLVHATTGTLPRKEIGMRREWLSAALAALSPTFRFGPVLVDPKTIRMPVANEIHGTWSWDHRSDITTWAEDPIVNATDDAHLRPDPATGTEGWLRLSPPPPPGKSKS